MIRPFLPLWVTRGYLARLDQDSLDLEAWIPDSTCPKEMFFHPPSYNRGFLHTSHVNLACACGVIFIQILNNPITNGYFVVVYLPFDHISSHSTFLENAGLDNLSFERYFEIGRAMLPYRPTKASEQCRHSFSMSVSTKVRR